jgi:hypothetical protein
MPGYGYGLSANKCIIGAKLAQIPGSVCSGCYALKGRYQFPIVKIAHAKRLQGVAHPQWEDAMVFLIRNSGTTFFRWHDSGDLQSVDHLAKIVRVAERLPEISFWLPTRELGIVRGFQRLALPIPKNLCVRVSAAMVDGPPPAAFPNTSGVVTDGSETCPSRKQGNICGACRACWDTSVPYVSYGRH